MWPKLGKKYTHTPPQCFESYTFRRILFFNKHLLKAMKRNPSAYEKQAIGHLQKRYKRYTGQVAGLFKWLEKPFSAARKALLQLPGAEQLLSKTNDSLVALFQDLRHWYADRQMVVAQYAEKGLHIRSVEDIGRLDLEQVDYVVKGLCEKYQLLARQHLEDEQEDGLPGMPTDIVALITLNQRAISEFATFYGFDITLQQERLFALGMLEYAATTDSHMKEKIMERLMRQAADISDEARYEQPTVLEVLRTLTGSITFQLVRAKVGQMLPIKGAIIGTGFNAYFTNEVCGIANLMYRQRFLLKKYGPEILTIAENADASFDPEQE